MPTCLRHVEETLVLVSGPGAGSSLSPCNASNGCNSHQLGSGHEWPPCPWSVEWSPSHVAHQLPGDVAHVLSTQTLSTWSERSLCVGAGFCVRAPCTSWILVWSQGKLLSLRAVHIPRHLNMGADILFEVGAEAGEWMLYPEVVKQIWRSFGQAQVDLFATHQTSHCPL